MRNAFQNLSGISFDILTGGGGAQFQPGFDLRGNWDRDGHNVPIGKTGTRQNNSINYAQWADGADFSPFHPTRLTLL
jgi:hypothetical protein